ncbi:MAG: IclR family transcriptional regulator [Dehalococcoidales bacterium]|nr:IclR family transcriptional regulator [Dehalococcoidales bacterium]
MPDTKQEYMKSLTKALEILQLFINRKEMALGEIAKLSGLNKSTVYRMLSVLIRYGYIKQKVKMGNYSLGPVYLLFSNIVKDEIQLRKIAMGYLTELAMNIYEVVGLAYYVNGNNTILEIFHGPESPQILKVDPGNTVNLPFHATSIGKIFLAYMTKEEIDKYLGERNLTSFTPNTITNINDIKHQLMVIRREGIAFDDEESTIGVRSIATGIRDNERIMGAICIIAPSVRLTSAKMKELIPRIKNCASGISKELGYLTH